MRELTTESEMLDCPFAIYRVYWNEESGGGSSVAAIGGMHNGDRWIAPTNWTNELNPTGLLQDQVSKIEKMVLIATQNEDQDWQKFTVPQFARMLTEQGGHVVFDGDKLSMARLIALISSAELSV